MRTGVIPKLIDELRHRPDVSVLDQDHQWQMTIRKGPALVCEITIPRTVLEWYACVKERNENKELWSDWMDYTGYDDRPHDELETEMAQHILAVVNRASAQVPILPIQIYEEEIR